MTQHALIKLFVLVLVTLLSACSALRDVKNDLEVADALSNLTGRVSLSNEFDASSVRVLLLKKEGDFDLSLINQTSADQTGAYTIFAPPGEFFLVAYIDINNDFVFQDETEKAGYLGQTLGPPKLIKVERQSSHEIDNIEINGLLAHTGDYQVSNKLNHPKVRTGAVVSLNDPMFSSENAFMGMMKPIEFVNTVGGGIFLFEPYDPDKIPVLMIHGIQGSVSNWESVISQMDTEKFQPFAVYFASGFRLDLISDFILKGMTKLQEQYNFNQFYVVSHSMGGLVARSFVKKYTGVEQEADIGLFATINSPMMGMDSANSGVRYSPIIIPSWRDVASGSAFINGLMQWDLPQDIPYYLFFSYESGDGDDGVVSLESQIPSKLQQEATRVFGFNASHAGVLSKTDFIEQFNQVLMKHSATGL